MLPSRILLYLSLFLSFILLILIMVHEMRYRRIYFTFFKPRHTCFQEKKMDVHHLDQLFMERIKHFKPQGTDGGRLTHVVMPYHPKQQQMVFDNLKSWSEYLPCHSDDSNASIDVGKD